MLDKLIIEFDKGLRTLFAPAQSLRKTPGAQLPEIALPEKDKKFATALMRVNHSGEICAQALYQGQALAARNAGIRNALVQASEEETEHLAWCEQRIHALGGRTSLLNPLLYVGSFTLGTAFGMLGDKWSLGFLMETERQVENHLGGHLSRIAPQDEKSRAVIEQMKIDEAQHATTALQHGAAELPTPIKMAMRLSAKVMTTTTFWV